LLSGIEGITSRELRDQQRIELHVIGHGGRTSRA
jgi:hypothetical protein